MHSINALDSLYTVCNKLYFFLLEVKLFAQIEANSTLIAD